MEPSCFSENNMQKDNWEGRENVIIAPDTPLLWGCFPGLLFSNQGAAVGQGHF